MQTPLTVAAGAYLRRLREGKRWFRRDVEAAVWDQFEAVISGSTVRQIEEGRVRDGAKLAMVNFVVGGEARQLDGLLRLRDATPEQGVALADAHRVVATYRGMGDDAPAFVRGYALLLAAYSAAVEARDVAAQREALATLVDHFRRQAAPPPGE